jgi:COX assembly protein 2
MHPTLTPHKHKDCYEVIMNLSNCHLQNPILKFVGYCNSYKTELNACLQEEVSKIILDKLVY